MTGNVQDVCELCTPWHAGHFSRAYSTHALRNVSNTVAHIMNTSWDTTRSLFSVKEKMGGAADGCGAGDGGGAGVSDGCNGSWITVNISSSDNIESEGRIEATGFNSAWYTSQPSSWSGHAVFTHRMGVVSFFTLAFFTGGCSFFTWGSSFLTLGSCNFLGGAFLFFPWPLSFEALVFFSVGVKTLLIPSRAVFISSTCAEVILPLVSRRECFLGKTPYT